MIELKARVRDALEGVCARVVYGDANDVIGRECVLWRESGNRRYAQADAREYLAELNYTLDIFASGAERAAALLALADARMTGMGFRRENAAEQFERETGLNHISARYRVLTDGAGNMYQ